MYRCYICKRHKQHDAIEVFLDDAMSHVCIECYYRLPDEQLQCALCGESLSAEEAIEVVDGVLCEACYEHDRHFAAKLSRFSTQYKAYLVGSFVYEDMEGNDATDEVKRILRPTHYKDLENRLQEGYVKLAKGWVDPEHPYTPLLEWLERLKRHGDECPGEGLYVLGVQVEGSRARQILLFCSREDREAIVAWLNEEGFTRDMLERTIFW